MTEPSPQGKPHISILETGAVGDGKPLSTEATEKDIKKVEGLQLKNVKVNGIPVDPSKLAPCDMLPAPSQVIAAMFVANCTWPRQGNARREIRRPRPEPRHPDRPD